MKKKTVIILLCVVAAVGAIGGVGYHYKDAIMRELPVLQGKSSKDKVYVERVSKVMNQGAGTTNRFNGVVETQDTYEVNIDSSRDIDEILVEVGDVVEEGQELVTYDTSDIELQIDLANLDIDGIQNEIDSNNKRIATLQEELAKATDEEDKFDFNSEIQSLQTANSQSSLDLEAKRVEIAKYREQLEDSAVISKQAGTVKEINENEMDANGETAPFMRIMKEGKYRIKGTVDEQNVWTITPGASVIVRSRVDEEQVWHGTLGEVNTEETVSDSMDYMTSSSGGESATKYPFYVELDSMDGLLLGQHVYIEMDEGQEEEKEGVWLYADYMVEDDGGFFAWVANDKDRLEKRYLEVGEFDEMLGEYEILSGLEQGDYIAWPMEGLYEGVATVTDMSEVDYESPLYNQGNTEMPVEAVPMPEGVDGGADVIDGMDDMMLDEAEPVYDLTDTEDAMTYDGDEGGELLEDAIGVENAEDAVGGEGVLE